MRLLSAALLVAITTCIASAQTYSISTFAGGGLPVNIPGTSAGISPQGIATDAKGNVFFTDPGRNTVLRLDAATGLVTLIAGNGTAGFSGDDALAIKAQLSNPSGIAVSSAGDLYIADSGNQRIRKVSNGVITTVAGGGSGGQGLCCYDGPATNAELGTPSSIAVDSRNNLYIAVTDFNTCTGPNNCLETVRKVSNGLMTTLGEFYSTPDGTSYPVFGGLAVDSAGNLYVAAEAFVFKVSGGVTTVVAGNGTRGDGGDNGPATNGQVDATNIAVDAAGNVYIANFYAANFRIRRISNGIITTIAGTGMQGYSGDNGPATSAEFSYPFGLAVDIIGNLYIADFGNSRIRKISNGIITTVAGNGTAGYSGDNGPAAGAQLNLPSGLAVDLAGDLYIEDTLNNRVRKVANGVITTVAGSGGLGSDGDNGPAITAAVALTLAPGIAVDSAGGLYIADVLSSGIRKIVNGVITTVAGDGTRGVSGDNGPATSAELVPGGIAVDSAGSLYIAGLVSVRKVSAGIITTVAGNGTAGYGGDNGPATSAQLNGASAVAVDPAGNLYIADTGNTLIRRVSNAVITTVAGNLANTNGLSSAIAVDSGGNLYIASQNQILKVSNGVITAIAGDGTPGFSGDGGEATNARFEFNSQSAPGGGLAVDGAGNVYVSDSGNNRIRLLTPGTTPSITPNGIVPVYSSIPIIQPGSWVSIYGTNLASTTTIWNNDFPTSLGGTSVTIDNKPAYLWVVSPTQINLQVPDDSTTGPVSVVVTTASGTTTSTVTLAPQAPSFSLLGDNKHVAAEIATPSGTGAYANGTYDLLGPANTFSFFTRPVKAGETLTLYGVGFGPTNPAVPAGKVFSGSAPPTTPVTVTIGGLAAPVSYSGITQAGLYQINLTVPAAPSGDQPLTATINGVQTTPGPVVAVQ